MRILQQESKPNGARFYSGGRAVWPVSENKRWCAVIVWREGQRRKLRGKKACNYLAAMLKNRQIDICLSRELFLCGVAAVLFVFIN